jgi:tetratricopeptide (TPR) repeat protein
MKELGVGRMGTPAPDPESEESKLAEIKGLVKATRKTMEEGKAELADRYLESIVAVQMPDAAKKAALREVAELYESHGDRVKAAAIYEKLCTLMENDTEMPLWLVKLGVLYREAGAYQLAISRFYGVINMAIKVGGRDFESQQGIARKAQREIADTHFLKGDFEQAQKFYNMALRSELSKEDRAMMLFRAGHCTFMRDDPAGAVAIFERFLKDYPQHPSSPEARYMLASAYRVQNRPQESFDTVMDLLRGVQSKRDADPKVWAFWQKKAGNEFANEFYQRGEFVNAVTIYQALAALAETPEWRWPVVYQMGLCFERLGLKPRATEAYQYILGEAEKPEVKERALPESLQSLTEMAKWRLEHLSWDDGVRATLRLLTGPEIK